MISRVCVFTGSSPGHGDEYRQAATDLGTALVEAEYDLVYGGANVGLMGVIADAVLAGGGTAIGVLPRGLMEHEVAHEGLSELHLTDSMHERKALMAELSDAFVALPGGFGTIDEFFEMLTWSQLGLHKKAVRAVEHRRLLRPTAGVHRSVGPRAVRRRTTA